MAESTPAPPPSATPSGHCDDVGFVRGYCRYEDGEYQWVRSYWRNQEHRAAELTADEIDYMCRWLDRVVGICQERIAVYLRDREHLADRLHRATARYEAEELRLQIEMVDGHLDDERTALAGAQGELRNPPTVRERSL